MACRLVLVVVEPAHLVAMQLHFAVRVPAVLVWNLISLALHNGSQEEVVVHPVERVLVARLKYRILR
jgi:hypothetical protein